MTIATVIAQLADRENSTHNERVDHLATTLRSYMPIFQEAVRNASSFPIESAGLAQAYDDASDFLNTWKAHSTSQPVTTEEFNRLRAIYHVIDDVLHTYGPVSRKRDGLSMAAFAAIGK